MIKPISKKKYYETISEQICQAILSGEWSEGGRVPTEDELARIFDVGRGSIREAITNLQMTGILVSSPGIGTYVAENAIACINNSQLASILNNSANVEEMTEARKVLEPQLAAYAAEHAGAVDKARMEEALDKAKACETVEDWKKSGHLFHLELCDTCKNRILTSLFKSLEEQTRKKQNETVTVDDMKKTVAAYESILDAIVKKDASLAAKLMSDLL